MLRQLRPALFSVVVMAIVFGGIFPLLITGIAQVAFPYQANGSLLSTNNGVVGSSLIGQPFTAPGYFHPRPSAAGAGYDATASGGTNLGPTSKQLIADIQKLAAAYRAENMLSSDTLLPADAVTRSASGLDPDISPANADLQVARVAKARGMTPSDVKDIVAANTSDRTLSVLGEPRVNVLQVNLALDRTHPAPVHTP